MVKTLKTLGRRAESRADSPATITLPLCNASNHDRHKKYSPSIYHNKLSSSWSDGSTDWTACGCDSSDNDTATGLPEDASCCISNSISVSSSCSSVRYAWDSGDGNADGGDSSTGTIGNWPYGIYERRCERITCGLRETDTVRTRLCGRTRTCSRRRRWPWLLLASVTMLLMMARGCGGLAMDTVAAISDGNDGGLMGDGGNGVFSARYSEKIGNLEKSIAAVFNKVAYGSTTTKRSIPDNVFVPSLTTVPTPPLTTFRYREREKDQPEETNGRHHQQQQPQLNLYHRNYEMDLERDHALPTSAPNADILKSNSNPTYPNPNRHHNHDHDRHRHNINSTPAPSVHNLLKKGPPTIPMYSGDMPSYSPPARSFFTPRVPSDYQNPFADKPTLRGTNSDSVMYGNGGAGGGGGAANGGGAVGGGTVGGGSLNRRPIPPPSLMPGQERIPYRPPDLVGGSGPAAKPAIPDIEIAKQPPLIAQTSDQRKKALNTPAQNKHNGNRVDLSAHDPRLDPSGGNFSEPLPNGLHFPSISRILSGSNGRKEDIPEVLLRTVTARPHFAQPVPIPSDGQTSTNLNNNRDQDRQPDRDDSAADDDELSTEEEADGADETAEDEDDFGMFPNGQDEPKTQPKIKQSATVTKSTQSPLHQSDSSVYSTQVIQNLANIPQQTTVSSMAGAGASPNSGTRQNQHSTGPGGAGGGAATWAVAWNIHVYLSAILFTILAVYSIFKMIFYDKLTHLFNQSYFICIHLILIVICLARIFFLCYDAYNIHSSFHTFISELLLNLPATFLTISFAILILFLLIRSLNHKNNRYSALMRPLTVVVGSSVHVGLCITLHYVESTTTGAGGMNGAHHGQQLFYQNRASAASYNGQRNGGGNIHSAPRVLSLICQIIYIFVCLSLGLFYLYVYRILKRILRNKSQNYIHGYQNLSYAIHITIATALLFILLAALQVYGAISISTTRPLISSSADIDWLQCGYQFSLRLIEIAIITLMSWVTGLKTGASKVLQQREKGMDTHNVSGFALFPCTSSSSQEHFESDYPAICNANTNLHTYTMRTGKPIYDDNFALNSLGMDNPLPPQGTVVRGHVSAEFQVPNSNEFTRTYETNSARSSSHASEPQQQQQQQRQISDGEFLNDSGTMPDHYENPNFELRSNGRDGPIPINAHHDMVLDNCYSEPMNAPQSGYDLKSQSNFDFQNFEKPSFDRPVMPAGVGTLGAPVGTLVGGSGTEFRASKNLKAMKNNNTTAHHLDRQQYDNPERRSSNSTHSYASGRNFNNLNYQSHHNSFERRGIRKSGTLNNIGGGGAGTVAGGGGGGAGGGGGVGTTTVMPVHGRGGASSTSSNSSNGGGRASGVQTLSSSSRSQQQQQQQLDQHLQRNVAGRLSQQQQQALHHKKDRHRSSIERSAIAHAGYMLPVDDLDYVVGGAAVRSFDTTSNASSEGASSCNGVGGGGGSVHMSAGGGIRYQSDRGAGVTAAFKHQHHMSQQSMGGGGIVAPMPTRGGGGGGLSLDAGGDAQHSSSSGESATSGSMLVAEHGFVRFRAIDTAAAPATTVPAQAPQPNASFRTTGRGKERQFIDS